MEKYYVSKSFNPSPIQLKNYVDRYISSNDYITMNELEKYYRGQNIKINSYKNSNDNINNRIISGYPRFISTVSVGYFLGADNAITYQFPNNAEEIRDILKYNDEPFVNKEIGKNCSIFGCGVEQCYIDKNGEFRFTSVDPREVIIFFENNVDEDIHSAIRFRNDNVYDEKGNEKEILTIDYYHMDGITTYVFDGSKMISQEENNINPFNDIPFIYYQNPDGLGDYQTAISIIDEYDKLISNNANVFDYFNDMYLITEGFELDQDNVKALKEGKYIAVPDGGKIYFLEKPQLTQETAKFIDILNKDIHKFTNTPDVLSESFFTSSGIAIKYKLQGLEYLTSVKESNFRKGILRRFELMSNVLSLINKKVDFAKIEIVFNRNTIEDLGQELDAILKLKDVVSNETLLERIPNVNPDIEMERMEKEKANNMKNFMNIQPIPNNNEEQNNIEEENKNNKLNNNLK